VEWKIMDKRKRTERVFTGEADLLYLKDRRYRTHP